MSIDMIGNFLTIIRNGLMVRKRFVVTQMSQQKLSIAKVLKDEGFIRDYEKFENDSNKPGLKVVLKYVDGQPAINEITRISRPGLRRYEGLGKITRVIGGLGVSILSTNRGIITDKDARKLEVGGEVLCHVW